MKLHKNDIEYHADLEHEIWSSWMQYMFSKGTFNDDGTWTMPAWAVSRWKTQADTPYNQLTEKEKESDREQVMKHLHLIEFADIDRLEGTKYNENNGLRENVQ